MIRHLLYRLSSCLPCRIISDNGRPYLERYYLCTVFGVRCYIHRFVASDPDRGLHDHPWPWAFSLILAGEYMELTRSGAKTVRFFNFITGDAFHRVILPQNLKSVDFDSNQRVVVADGVRECWTLFCHRAKTVKEWGFLRPHDAQPQAMLWAPINYPEKRMAWWNTAPRGRDCRQRQAEAS